MRFSLTFFDSFAYKSCAFIIFNSLSRTLITLSNTRHMGSRYLLWVFLLVGIFLAPLAKVEAQNWKDVTYNTCGGDGAFITGQQLVAGINMPPGLRTGDLTWSFPAELTAAPSDPKALDPVISGFVHGESYLVEVQTNSNGHNYRITINATESIGPYELTSDNGTGDVLLDNSTSYPVPFNLSPTDGGSYQYYYSNGDDISGTSSPLTNPNPWSFSPTNQTEVYSVYGVVNKTVGGLACKAKSNEIQIADEKVVLEVVGGGSICDGARTPLPLSVKPYVDTYTYTWYKDGGFVGTGDSYTIDRSGDSWTGADRVVVTNGATEIAISEDVEVGAYQLTADLSANDPTTVFCGDVSAELTGSAVSTEGNNLDYRWENSGTAVPAGSGFIPSGASDISDTEPFTATGTYRFVVRESDNPLCFAQSPAVIVESTIEANQLPVTGSSVCEGSSINDITLPASEAGVTYRLMYDNGSGTKLMVHEWDSEGTPYTFPSVSDVGSYTVEATGCSGVVQMTGGPFVISALPDEDLDVVLDGPGCAGSTHTITVNGAKPDVEYRLYRDGEAASGWRLGSDLPFPVTTQAGDYSVKARRNGCEIELNRKVRIGVVPKQLDFSPTTACADIPFNLELVDSEAGVHYTLFNSSGDEEDSYYSEGGGDLSFTVNQPEGTYTIVAESADGCTLEFTESLVLQARPIMSYSLFTGNDPACAGTATAHILSLNGSEEGVTYYLMRGTTQVSESVEGTGNPISFPDGVAQAGTYRVEASNGGCRVVLSTSLEVYPRPEFFVLDDVGSFCDGEMVTIRLAQSQSGAMYSLYRDGAPHGTEKSSPFGGPIEFVEQYPPGVYTVGASFVAGACARMMGGQVVVNDLPNPGINSGDFYCADAGTIQLRGVPADGQSSSWSINGVTGSVPWFTHAPDNPLAQVVVPDLIAARVGAGTDRATLTFNYHFTDENGCAATASKPITFVDDQSDNLDFRFRMAATDPWSNFAGDLVTCQTVDDILLQALFLDSSSPTASGVFSTDAPDGSITNSGTGDEGKATFHPSVAGNGLWAVTYTYIDPASGCEADITYNIQVGTTLSLHGLSAQYCADNNVDQEWYGLVTGGELIVAKDGGPTESVWLEDPAERYLFNPQAKGAGDYEVTYRFTSDLGGANECVNEITQEITVRAELNAAFDTDDSRRIYCLTNGPVDLLPAPVAGSSYTGTGVGTGVFNPALAGVGIHRITRTVQDGFCSASEWIDVEVVAPDVPVVLDQYEFCYNETGLFPVEAGDLPVVGGVYSRDQAEKNVDYTFSTDAVNALFRFQADGVTRDYASTFTVRDGDTPIYFDPSRVPAIGGSDLTINIYLAYDSPVDEGGCEVYTVQPILVKSVQAVNFGTTEPMEFCQNSTPVVMEGRFSGSGAAVGSGYFTADFPMDNEVDGAGTGNNGRALFDPSLVTPTSAYQITYNYENPNGCVSTRTKSFEIKAAPITQRVTPVDPNGGIFCQGSGGVTIGLQGTQIDVRYILQKDGVDVDAAVQFIDGQWPGNTPRTFPNPVTEPGVYTVRAIMIGIADGCDAQMEGSVIVDEKVVVGVLESTSHETCAGSDDGSVTFSAYGGVAPYTYTLQQGGVDITTSASGTFGGLAPGTYTVHIEDAVGCDWTSAGFEIKAGSSINVVSEDEVDVVCFGESNGAFTVVATGLPSGNYEFQLSGSSDWLANGTGRYVFNNLPAGTYDVTVRDADNPGCQAVMTPSVEIEQPTEAVYMAVGAVTDITCSLEAEGEIEVMAAGGNDSGDFDYVLYREVSPGFWVNIKAGTEPAGTPHVFEDLFAGNYRVVAIDPDACSVTEHYTVDGPR